MYNFDEWKARNIKQEIAVLSYPVFNSIKSPEKGEV